MCIKRIKFVSYSGYGPADEAWTETLILKPNSVSFVHKPELSEVEMLPEDNRPAKWKCKYTSENYKRIFHTICELIQPLLGKTEMVCDGTGLDISVIFADKTSQEFISFVGSSSSAVPILKMLSLVIPPMETKPKMLEELSEDYNPEDTVD